VRTRIIQREREVGVGFLLVAGGILISHPPTHPPHPTPPSIPISRELRFVGGAFDSKAPRMPCYRVLDAAGRPLEGAEVPHPLEEGDAVELYTAMARMQVGFDGWGCGGGDVDARLAGAWRGQLQVFNAARWG
jgi:hypothetical protein